MLAEVMEIVAGQLPERRAGVLAGFRRGKLRGRLYPGLVPDAAARVEGVLWEGLDATALARIDRFEGALYERQHGEVMLPAAERRATHVYVLVPAQRSLLLERDWDEAEFRTLYLRGYLAGCHAFARAWSGGGSASREQVEDE